MMPFLCRGALPGAPAGSALMRACGYPSSAAALRVREALSIESVDPMWIVPANRIAASSSTQEERVYTSTGVRISSAGAAISFPACSAAARPARNELPPVTGKPSAREMRRTAARGCAARTAFSPSAFVLP